MSHMHHSFELSKRKILSWRVFVTLQFSYKHNKLKLPATIHPIYCPKRYTFFYLFLFLCTGTETNLQKVMCILGISEARKEAILISNVYRYFVLNDLPFLGWSI